MNGFETLRSWLAIEGDLSNDGRRGNLPSLEGLSKRMNPGQLTDVLAIACETITTERCNNLISRCSVVNMYGDAVLDVYVDAECRILKHRTSLSGINENDVNQGRVNGNLWGLKRLHDELSRMFNGRKIVGHNVIEELDVSGIASIIVISCIDTQSCPSYGIKPQLRHLLKEKFGVSIQDTEGVNDSVEGACGAMFLYRTEKTWLERRVGPVIHKSNGYTCYYD